jgi:16S rRNA (guanine(527)-N(7))-methyltransferase RsmG
MPAVPFRSIRIAVIEFSGETSFLMRNEFIDSIKRHQGLFGLELPEQKIEKLADYYGLVQEHNPLLHLVGPCPPEEFATRHILESLTLLEYLPENTKFADVGAGAGLPSIPCLIARTDLRAILIESKEKKSDFLDDAVTKLDLTWQANIVNRQFEEADPGDATVITCRALDKFGEKLPRLIKWSRKRQLLLFGGPDLKAAIEKNQKIIIERLMPMSERRYLYVA